MELCPKEIRMCYINNIDACVTLGEREGGTFSPEAGDRGQGVISKMMCQAL